jgi:hypothetical protein
VSPIVGLDAIEKGKCFTLLESNSDPSIPAADVQIRLHVLHEPSLIAEHLSSL